ncbi:GNAT family N-acetyltransferase [Bradyrhizobium huanghuaihaiense]|uniref:acyl-homoserine-lactone synthase n=1 Tax=Bradyrhizobium huanghuaihaiense TaxID=990078 RepID=UPI0021AA293C|nr:acyl-homoserine-lactone synthase [Bradyrhizobium sp. CB3035]UWU80536.1 GNAT family N-acetyltransferase [Bradyrhizobium sp. CB3035]
MLATALNHHAFGQHVDLLADMYRLRRQIFKDRLDWSVAVSGDMEVDLFDALSPTYLLVLTDDGAVVGSVRLLRTVGPNMLADTFPFLLGDSPVPRSEKVLESSRFCVDTHRASQLAGNGINRATIMMFAAMIEYLKATNADSIVTVTDVRMERILRRAGWPLERLGAPCRVGQTTALAGYLHASDAALHVLYQAAGVPGRVLIPVTSIPAAA